MFLRQAEGPAEEGGLGVSHLGTGPAPGQGVEPASACGGVVWRGGGGHIQPQRQTAL